MTDLIRDKDRRLSQLVIVQGKSDLCFDLFCNPDTYDGMTAFLPADLEKIKTELVDTFKTKERFNQYSAPGSPAGRR